ncbi:hypothetical protein GGI07_004934, partial [Coemansia sp. Benny D115]
MEAYNDAITREATLYNSQTLGYPVTGGPRKSLNYSDNYYPQSYQDYNYSVHNNSYGLDCPRCGRYVCPQVK